MRSQPPVHVLMAEGAAIYKEEEQRAKLRETRRWVAPKSRGAKVDYVQRRTDVRWQDYLVLGYVAPVESNGWMAFVLNDEEEEVGFNLFNSAPLGRYKRKIMAQQAVEKYWKDRDP